MKKKELLKISPLPATDEMIQVLEKEDVKVKTKAREYQLFMRCVVQNGILKAALYYPDVLCLGGRDASYEVYIDRDARRFITYDRVRNKWLSAKVDRLVWPKWINYYPNVWVSGADADTIREYLGDQYVGYDGIFEFQCEIREEALVRKYKAKTDVWDKDMALIPELPKDWTHWVDKVGIEEHFIFYDYKKGGAKTGYCTHCGKEVPIKEKPYHNKTSRCTCCHHKITYKANGRTGAFSTADYRVYLLQTSSGNMILRGFWVSRIYSSKEDRKTLHLFCYENQRIIYDSQINPRSYYWWNYKNRGYRWAGEKPSHYWGYFYGINQVHGEGKVYRKNMSRFGKSVLKSTGLDMWLRKSRLTDPHEYLLAFHDFPQLEQVMKANLPQLFDECFANSKEASMLVKCPGASQLTKALGIDGQKLRRLRHLNGGLNLLNWLQKEKELGKSISQELIDWFTKQKIRAKDIDFIWGKMTPVQIYNYLNRQAKENHETIKQMLIIWQDYLSMAEQQGIDTSDEIIFRARLLRQRHDELMMVNMRSNSVEEAEKLSKKYPHVNEICHSLKKYEHEDSEYSVVAPLDILDILVEGNMLHHCVRNNDRYLDRMEQHETYLLFLRKSCCITQPYYTMEIEPNGTIRQVRAEFDRHGEDFEDIKAFLKKWQTVVRGRLSEEDHQRAKQSKKLRHDEFEQLRKSDVRINMGDLAGQRLVDVLTEDLMEQIAA